jgi:hypothetical protein
MTAQWRKLQSISLSQTVLPLCNARPQAAYWAFSD